MTDTPVRVPRGDWAAARSLADLGNLTALWLEGRIWHQPGYADPDPGEAPGPDPETGGLVPVLAACNRAGFVTRGSQPGESADGWDQRAAAEGFCDQATAARLALCASGTDLIVIAHDPAQARKVLYDRSRAVWVTRSPRGRHVTGFAVRLPLRHLRDGWIGYGECHRDAVAALCGAWQVTIIDPVWGRNDVLQAALGRFAAGRQETTRWAGKPSQTPRGGSAGPPPIRSRPLS